MVFAHTNLIHLPDITAYHWTLAYGGLFLSVFYRLSIAEESTTRVQRRKEMFSFFASILAIPIVFILAQESWIKEQVPITNTTAFIVGSEIKIIIKALYSMSKKSAEKFKTKAI